MPVGTQNEVGHFIAENRGSPVTLSHDDSHVHHRQAILHNIQLKVWYVDENVALPEVLREPAPPFKVAFDGRLTICPEPAFTKGARFGS